LPRDLFSILIFPLKNTFPTGSTSTPLATTGVVTGSVNLK
jgi:hypothetical protein